MRKFTVVVAYVFAMAIALFVALSDASVAQSQNQEASTSTYTPTDDAMVYEGLAPSWNYGSDTKLKTYGYGGYRLKSYLKFAVSDLPSGTTIQSAKLRLWDTTDPTDDGPAVYTSAPSWSESNITWDNRPAERGPGVADAGAIDAGTWAEFDVTPLVTGNGVYSLVLSQSGTDEARFASKENGDTTKTPQLVLTTTTTSSSPSPPPPPPSPPPSGSGGVALGTFPGNSYGNPAWDTSLRAIHDYEALTGSTPKYVEVFHAFSGNGSFKSLPPAIPTMVTKGYIPVITWEAGDYVTGAGYSPRDIAAGYYDSYIHSYAKQVAALGKEVDIRLFHELNMAWPTWGVGKSGASNEDIVNAWRHVHDVFKAEGATNAKFVFCPNERHNQWTDSHPYADYYPGDAYVDYLALDGYNWADAHGEAWYSFDEVFRDSYAELTALNPDKPVMIAEYASHTSPGDKAQWIKDAQAVVKSGKYPRIKALLWFENNQEGASWRIDTSQASIDAYKALAADPYYQGTMP